MKIRKLTEVLNEEGELTHKMCVFCFDFIPVDELYVDENGQRWDSCGKDETECQF